MVTRAIAVARARRALLLGMGAGTGTLGMASLLAACGLGQFGGRGAPPVKFGDPVRVVFWHTQTGTNEKALAEMFGRFTSSNGKNIELKGEYQGNYTQLFQKVMAGIQAGSPPDLAIAYEGMIAEYMKAGAVVDLGPYAESGAQALSKESLADIIPQYLNASRYEAFGRKLLSFPFAKGFAVQYHNEDLLRTAGQTRLSNPTFDEFRRQVAAATKKDSNGRTIVYGQYIKKDASFIDAFILANGGELLTKDNRKVRFNEPPGLEVFEMWRDMVRTGQAYTSEGFNYQADFGQGRVATVPDTSTSRVFLKQEVLERDGSREKFRWGIGMIPQKDVTRPVTVMFGGNFVAFKTTPLKQAAAWEWIKFFTDRDQTVNWSIKSSFMPVRRSAADHPDLKAHWDGEPQARQAFQLTPTARPEPTILAWQEIRELVQAALTSVIAGRATPKAALDSAAAQANKLIDERR